MFVRGWVSVSADRFCRFLLCGARCAKGREEGFAEGFEEGFADLCEEGCVEGHAQR
jgi:hypothetical protein